METPDGKKTSKTAREKDTEREGVEGRGSGRGDRVNRRGHTRREFVLHGRKRRALLRRKARPRDSPMKNDVQEGGGREKFATLSNPQTGRSRSREPYFNSLQPALSIILHLALSPDLSERVVSRP